MGFPLQLDQQQYEALVALARNGATTPDLKRQLDSFLKALETSNNIVRHGLWVQWQEQDQPLPPKTRFPEKWPPELQFYLELISRPISRVDVEAVLAKKARRPTNIRVTKDPGAIVGWASLDQFFIG